MDDPGWTAGSINSPSPARGPDPSHLISLAIFDIETAILLSAPDVSMAAS